MIDGSKNSPSEYDLCVVGAGIMGMLSAYRVSIEYPEWQILLIDKDQPGDGASSRAASLSSTLSISDEVHEMSLESDNFYLQLQHDFPDLPVRSLPIIYFIEQDNHTAFQTTRSIEAVSLQELQQTAPPFTSLPECGILLKSDSVLHIRPVEMVQWLKSQLDKTPNITIRTDEQVVAIEKTGMAKVSVMTAQERKVSSSKILLATGPWLASEIASELLPKTDDYRIKKIVAMEVDYPPHPDCPVLCFPEQDAFLLPDLEHNNFLLSIHSSEWDVHPDGILQITQKDRETGQAVLSRYAPELLPFYKDGRVFCDVYTDDGNPSVKQLSGTPEVLLATGGNGRGVRLGPAIAGQVISLL